MKKLVFIAALGLGISSPSWSADTTSFTANLVDAGTMDTIFAQSAQETQLARRGGGHRGGHRGGHHHHRSRGRHGRRGDWVGPAVGGVIVGAIIANQASSASRSSSRHEAAKRRCAEQYRSYDWRSETYVTYGGQVRSCP